MATLAALILLLPWLRRIPSLGPLPTVAWPLVAGAAVALVAVVGLYLHWGRPDMARGAAAPAPVAAMPTSDAPTQATTTAKPAGAAAAGSMFTAISGLQGRLAKGGGTSDDWELLAKSYEFLGQPENAAKVRKHQLPALPAEGPGPAAVGNAAAPVAPVAMAPKLSTDSVQWLAKADAARRAKKFDDAAAIYAQLAARNQMTADSWADYADTAASIQDHKLAGKPETYIARALALDPQNPKALWLKASADEEAGRLGAAVVAWQQLQGLLPPGSADAKIVAASLERDRGASGPAPGAAAPAAGAAAGTRVGGEITVSAALQSRVTAGATLFIVAKAAEGGGVPLAVMRQPVGSWPAPFMLSDAQAMMPGRNLSSTAKVIVEARISKSGDAIRAPGDLLGSSGVISPADHKTLKIQIAEVVK